MKYEFTGETMVKFGVTFKRIRALRDIARWFVKAGDLGGWLQGNNLDQDGDAWVYGNARVSGNAQVSGNALVYGDAHVYGNARVSGNAQVSGDARVSGDAWVYGNAQVSGDAWVYGNAQVSGNARVSGNAQVSGNAWVSGDAWVYGDARVSGNAQVSGNARCLLTVGPLGSRAATLTVTADAKIGVRFSTGCFSGSRDEFLKAIESTHGDNEHGKAYAMAVALADVMIDPPKDAQ